MLWIKAALATFRASRSMQIVALVVALGGLALLVRSCDRQRMGAAKEAGRLEQQGDDLRETLNRVEQANDTRAKVRNPGDRAAYDECVRSARRPENCKRFLPQ